MDRKVAIIGAGAVGATLAQRVLEGGLADVVLVDIMRGMAEGKACDLSDAAPIIGHTRDITGTDDYGEIKGSGIVVITAGFPRKPGMTREDLISKNAAIVKDVASRIKAYAPDSIIIVVTNPLDSMTYLACKTTGFPRYRVFGMAGVLDGARFVNLISQELNVPRSSVSTYILGSHGDTMVPLISKTKIGSRSIKEALSEERLKKIVSRTRERGAEIVRLFGSGSAYYSPSAAVYKMIDVIMNDKKETLVVSACLNGEYGLSEVCMGVPCILGEKGIEKIVELELDEDERDSFSRSARSIKSSSTLL
jgi:malate dehydrogenase